MYLVYFIHDFDGWTDKGILIGLFESLDDIDYSKIHQILIDEIFKHITENDDPLCQDTEESIADYILIIDFMLKNLKLEKLCFKI